MKKTLLSLLLIIGLTLSLNAQWTSPGNGNTYTLTDLIEITDGVVTTGPDGFLINADLTISNNDVLKIDNQASRVDVANVLITIKGTMTCTNTVRARFYGLNETEHFGMRFENATNCNVKNLYFSDAGGIQVIESEVTFDNVKFMYFTRDYCNAAINIFNCDPIIKDCTFMMNKGAAISSPANGQSSPQILNCTFDANVDVAGVNIPQINLGPGSDDTIRIVGNNIDDRWAAWHVGGISIADLMGVGSTKVLLKNNVITDHRYGYNQQGQTISSVIVGNQFLNNNHETNPDNGGSGISIYGSSQNNKAFIRHNVITGNLWGITALVAHDIDLGTEDDWGYNEIHDNGNGGVIYDLYNYSNCNITAVGNNWGTLSESEVEDHIVHQADNSSLGLVTYIPFIGYDQLEDTTVEPTDTDLKKAVIYTITGQRVNPESLRPGVYIMVTENGPKKIIIQQPLTFNL